MLRISFWATLSSGFYKKFKIFSTRANQTGLSLFIYQQLMFTFWKLNLAYKKLALVGK